MTSGFASGADDRSAAGVPKLHPGELADPKRIRQLFVEVHKSAVPLTRGLNRKIEPEVATVQHVGESSLKLDLSNFEPDTREILFLNFAFGSELFFFQARVLARPSDSSVEIEIPDVLYQRERRSRQRVPASGTTRVSIEHSAGHVASGLAVVDLSSEGMAVDIPDEIASALREHATVKVSSGVEPTLHGVVRNRRPSPQQGWTRIGLEVDAKPSSQLEWTAISDLAPPSGRERLAQTARVAVTGAQLAFDRALRRFGARRELPRPNVVDVFDSAGHPIKAIVNSWGATADATAVVVPPAWGRTKETLMPLALTIVECFRRSRLPIRVIRFDGVNKRGESYRDQDCLEPGCEQHRFTFSGGADDIRAVVDHLHADPESRPKATVLVSFSASSIEARRAVSQDPRIDGWVCVVGTADLQSMMKAISGGIDYALGVERGLKFGLQEILGVAVDMDLAGRDAIQNRLAYLSDARREMASIKVPITWIAGRHDAWMDRDRVRDAMSRGDTSRRKLIEIPTGHMLKSSRQALGVFQLVAREIAEIAGLTSVASATPNVANLERTRLAELARIKRRDVDLRGFWSDYLVGRDETVGFELMMLTSAYQEFMRRQIEALALNPGDLVVDVGSGTGGLLHYLKEARAGQQGVKVIELDFVRDALVRARMRAGNKDLVAFVEADLDTRSGVSIPVASGSVQAAIASLFISYVRDPRCVLRELHRILRPGGRIVVSSLRRDADMSKLFTEGAAELRSRWGPELGEWVTNTRFEDAVRGYMNEASRLLDLEEDGRFVFWDPSELTALLKEEGFEDVRVHESFGIPPQAGIASARRPGK